MNIEARKPLVSVITCTYNRANTLPKAYESLCKQTFKNFEWIVSDDGSNDGTRELIEKWKNENKLEIIYLYQDNNGKHIAANAARAIARGYFDIGLDSDDFMREDALETFIEAWKSIPQDEWQNFYAVKARCFDPETGKAIGKDIPGGRMICHYLDAKYKLKIQDEMWSMSRLEVTNEYPYPDIRGGRANGGLRFYPEGIGQDLASRKYKIMLINDALRGYTINQSTSLMGRGAKYDRSRENIFMWTHIVNDNLDYFWCDPKSFIKAAVGVSMDSFFLKYSIKKVMGMIHGILPKMLVGIFMPAGYMCYLRRK